MNDVQLGRVARAIRHRLRQRQADVAQRARVHRSTVGLLERGHADRLSVGVVRDVFAALGAYVDLRPQWRGPQLDRLLDERHASLVAAWRMRLERWHWLVRIEVSYSRFGERGRVDLLAHHPATGTLVVTEVKTELVDAQELLGAFDAKVRLATHVAASVGWPQPRHVVPMLLFRDAATVRRRVTRLAPLFTDFDVAGRSAVSWLRRPTTDAVPRGLLIFSDLSPVAVVRPKSLERVRLHGSGVRPSVDQGRDRRAPVARRR